MAKKNIAGSPASKSRIVPQILNKRDAAIAASVPMCGEIRKINAPSRMPSPAGLKKASIPVITAAGTQRDTRTSR